MAKAAEAELAVPGSLAGEVLDDLKTYQAFVSDRDQLVQRLYGRSVPRSFLRDEIVRRVLIDFGTGRVSNLSYYQAQLVHLGSHAATRKEISLLVTLSLVRVVTGEDDRRSALVMPTRKLVDWYSAQMPRLYKEIYEFLARRESQLGDRSTLESNVNVVQSGPGTS